MHEHERSHIVFGKHAQKVARTAPVVYSARPQYCCRYRVGSVACSPKSLGLRVESRRWQATLLGDQLFESRLIDAFSAPAVLLSVE